MVYIFTMFPLYIMLMFCYQNCCSGPNNIGPMSPLTGYFHPVIMKYLQPGFILFGNKFGMLNSVCFLTVAFECVSNRYTFLKKHISIDCTSNIWILEVKYFLQHCPKNINWLSNIYFKYTYQSFSMKTNIVFLTCRLLRFRNKNIFWKFALGLRFFSK